MQHFFFHLVCIAHKIAYGDGHDIENATSTNQPLASQPWLQPWVSSLIPVSSILLTNQIFNEQCCGDKNFPNENSTKNNCSPHFTPILRYSDQMCKFNYATFIWFRENRKSETPTLSSRTEFIDFHNRTTKQKYDLSSAKPSQ